MLISEIQMTKNQNDYNHVTWYSSDQDFWNKSIGRYTNSTFPLKQMKENIYKTSVSIEEYIYNVYIAIVGCDGHTHEAKSHPIGM